jgi:hypothetical protein
MPLKLETFVAPSKSYSMLMLQDISELLLQNFAQTKKKTPLLNPNQNMRWVHHFENSLTNNAVKSNQNSSD